MKSINFFYSLINLIVFDLLQNSLNNVSHFEKFFFVFVFVMNYIQLKRNYFLFKGNKSSKKDALIFN